MSDVLTVVSKLMRRRRLREGERGKRFKFTVFLFGRHKPRLKFELYLQRLRKQRTTAHKTVFGQHSTVIESSIMEGNTIPADVTTEQIENRILDRVLVYTELLTLPEFQKCDDDTIREIVNSQKTDYYLTIAYNLQLDAESVEKLRRSKREKALSYFHSLRGNSSASGHSQLPSRSQPQHWERNIANEDHFSPSPSNESSAESPYAYGRSRRKRDDDQSDPNLSSHKRRKIDFNSPDDSLEDREFNGEGSDTTSTSEADEVASESEQLPSQLERSEQVLSHPNNAVFPFDGASRKLMEACNAQITSIAKKFNTYSKYAQLGKHPPVPINASLVTMCQSKVAAEFVYGGQLLAIHQILEDFRRALEGIHIFRNEYIAVMEKQVGVLKSVPSFLSSQSQSLGELLSYLSRSEKIDDSLAFHELENECASFRAIKAFEGKLSRTKLKEYLIVSQVVRNLLSLLANISVTTGVLAEITMGEICTLSDELGELAARLYKEIYEEEREFHLRLNALELIQEVVVPCLMKGGYNKLEAIKLALLIKNEVNRRGDLAYQKFTAVASAGSTSPSDYFYCRNRRNEATIAFFSVLLATEIEARAPLGYFSKCGGFTRYALGMSMRKMSDVCRHFLDYRGFFESPCPESLFKRLVTVDTVKESKTKLVIFNKSQIDSLQALSRFNSELIVGVA